MAESKRAQRTAVSREVILAAAVEVLVEQGYAASTLEIQHRAGVSRGRLTHHFPSRVELLVAAAQHLSQTRLAEVIAPERRTVTAMETDARRIDQAIDYLWRMFQQPYFWASTELWLGARHNAALAAALLPAERKVYATIRGLADDAFGPHFSSHPRYHECRELLFTSMRGVKLTYSFDPHEPSRDLHRVHWQDAARALLLSESPARRKPSRR